MERRKKSQARKNPNKRRKSKLFKQRQTQSYLISGHAAGETPGPISNPEVKPCREKLGGELLLAAC